MAVAPIFGITEMRITATDYKGKFLDDDGTGGGEKRTVGRRRHGGGVGRASC